MNRTFTGLLMLSDQNESENVYIYSANTVYSKDKT